MKKSSIITLVCTMCLLICFSLVSYFFLQKENFYVQVSFANDNYNVKWDELEDAETYHVSINGEEVNISNLSSYNIDEYLVDDGTYQINVVAYDEDGNKISEKVLNYEYAASTEKDFLRKGTYYINGEYEDYIIENQEELEKLVWHTILYRENNVNFYVALGSNITNSNLNQLTKNYINTYPEYDAVNLGFAKYAKFTNTNVGLLCNFSYYLNEDFTLNHNNIPSSEYRAYNLARYDYEIDLDYAIPYETATETERTFAIDKDGVDEVVVNNTEQLFMAVQYGARPVFSDPNSVAAKVYNNAREVLKEINNSDNLTDYQKALNIYTYLGNNVKYDYVLYEYMAARRDFSIRSFGNYSAFYLEGVFLDLDNQYAVCDGLAKAYTLLCRIEGIECFKVNGEVVTVRNSNPDRETGENHAWNKVKITKDESINITTDAWSIVDVTWGAILASETSLVNQTTTKKQILSYLYFLVSEEDLVSDDLTKYTRKVTFKGTEAPTTAITKYKHSFYFEGENTEKKTSNDLYIENLTELQNIMKYAENKMKESGEEVIIDIRISSTNSELQTKMEAFFNSANSELGRKNWYKDLGITNAQVESIVVDAGQKVFDDYCIIFRFA